MCIAIFLYQPHQDSDRLGSLLADGIIRSFVDQCVAYVIHTLFPNCPPSLFSPLPRFSFCNMAALPSSHAPAPNPKVTACADTAQSWSSEAPPFQLLISPAFTPGCPRPSGSPSLSPNYILEPRVLSIFDNTLISQSFTPGLFTMTFL
jgi:hypothetical protein